ncbi:hypothetical protein J6590_018041 [Homalodisca vitripennis]|nr:hypothetical protein J6590_018041 [Homalodisca vitripennis]
MTSIELSELPIFLWCDGSPLLSDQAELPAVRHDFCTLTSTDTKVYPSRLRDSGSIHWELLPGEDLPKEVFSCPPDLVTVRLVKKIMHTVDVTVPYEDGWESVERLVSTGVAEYIPTPF